MSELPKIVRARLGAEAASGHPDADVLTAFREKSLPDRERRPVLAHLAQCADCRQVIALAFPPAESVNAGAVVREGSRWLQGSWIRWASLAACLVVVGAAVLIHPKPSPMAVRPSSEAEVALREQAATAPPAPAPAPAQEALTRDADKMAGNERAKQWSPASGAMVAPGVDNRVVATVPAPSHAEEKVPGLNAKAAAPGKAWAVRNQPAMATPAPAAEPAAGSLKKSAAPAISAAQATLQPTQEVAPLETTAEEQNPSPVAAAGGAFERGGEIPGKAKPAAPVAGAIGGQETNRSYDSLAQKAETAPAAARQFSGAVAQWMLSPEGQLQHSLDGGVSWQPVPIVEKAKFAALSAKGQDIWVGGAAGLLYHSGDAGTHWTQVKPTVDGAVLSTDIASLSFSDLKHGRLTTADGQTLTTADGGKSWQRQP